MSPTAEPVPASARMALFAPPPDHLTPLDRWRYRYVSAFSGPLALLLACLMLAELAMGRMWAPWGKLFLLIALVATFVANRLGKLRLASWILLAGITITIWILAPKTTPTLLPFAASMLIGAGLLLGVRTMAGFAAANLIYLCLWLALRPDATLFLLDRREPPVAMWMFCLALMTVNGWFVGVITHRTVRDLECALERANTDWLTGLANRSGFGQRLDEALSLGRRYHTPFSVLLLDVDFFKKVNDTFGHPTGDRVLIELARALQLDARKSDCVARYGGEEFALLLPYTDRAGALIVAERLRRNVASLLIFDDHHRRIAITISIGVSEFESSDSNGDALVSRADQALYRAKQAGRDRVIVSDKAA